MSKGRTRDYNKQNMPWVTLTLGLIHCGFLSSSQIAIIDNLHITDVVVALS